MSIQNYVNMDNRHKILFTLALAVHTAEKNLDFLQTCMSKKLIPSFTRFSSKFLDQVNWSKQTLEKKRFEKLEKALCTAKNTFITKKSALNTFVNSQLQDLSHTLKLSMINKIKRKVQNFRRKKDENQFLKLKKLESLSQSKIGLQRELLNFTNVSIPGKVKEVLTKRPAGGSPKMTSLMVQIERLIQHWSEYAKSVNIDPFRLWTYKTKISSFVERFSKCWEKNSFKEVTNFLDKNPEIKVVKVDKTSAFAIMNTNEYNLKLEKQFDSDQFKKLKNDPLDSDLRNLSSLLVKVKPFVSAKTYFSLRPIQSLKRAYGLVKVHKPDRPLRPIVSSLNSLVSGSETFLMKILTKFKPEFKFSLENSEQFRNFVLDERENFNHCVSFDIVSMYPSINLNRTLEYIVKKVYENPSHFFEEQFDKNNKKLPFMPKIVFREFLFGICTKYTSFHTENNFYRQVEGCSMGSKLSPLLCNIYMALFENEIVEDLLQKQVISHWKRYVDDVFVSLPKENVDKVFNKINNWEPNLKFTLDEGDNGLLNYLDMSLYKDNETNQFETKFYQKSIKSDYLSNFNSVQPKSYKISTLCGEIYRMNRICTNETNRDMALNILKSKFVKNSYPEKLISSKINEISSRNFQTNSNKVEREREVGSHPERNFTIKLDYTSDRCDKVCRELLKIIKEVTPEYSLRVSWKLISVEQVILPRLKKRPDKLSTTGCVYKFSCHADCEDGHYFGETVRRLQNRISEHFRSGPISEHIVSCEKYNSELIEVMGDSPALKERKLFFNSHFTVVEKNLLNYSERVLVEGIYVTLFQPTLNDQVQFRHLKIL